MAPPAEDDDICPYATSAEVEQLHAAARDGRRWGGDVPTAAGDGAGESRNGVDPAAVERRRTRPRRAGTAVTDRTGSDDTAAHHHRLEPPQSQATNDDFSMLYAQPHKLITKDLTCSTADNQNLFSNV